MKAKIILLACVALGIASCGNPHEHGDTNQSVHYFYVENRLDKEIKLKFDRALYSAGDLSEDYEINRHFDIYAYSDATTLVRVYDKGYNDKEAFSCFYYKFILYSVGGSRGDFCKLTNPYGGDVSAGLGEGEYWKYERLGR